MSIPIANSVDGKERYLVRDELGHPKSYSLVFAEFLIAPLMVITAFFTAPVFLHLYGVTPLNISAAIILTLVMIFVGMLLSYMTGFFIAVLYGAAVTQVRLFRQSISRITTAYRND